MLGRHCLKHWASTQATIALSSGEAELNGIARGAAHALGVKRMAADMGYFLDINIHSDAIAAVGIVRRRGIGRIRHLDTTDLWVQEKIRNNEIALHQIEGSKNPADLFTKHLPQRDMNEHMKRMGLEHMEGRPEATPALVDAQMSANH